MSLQNLVFAWSNLFFSSQGLIRTLKCQMQLALETDEHLTFHNLPMCKTSQRCFSIELCMFVILISSSTCQSLKSFIAAIFYWIQKVCYATTFFFLYKCLYLIKTNFPCSMFLDICKLLTWRKKQRAKRKR